MKLLVLTLRYDALGGLEGYGRDVVRTLRDLGHDVEVWSLLEAPGGDEDASVRRLAPRGRAARSLYHRTLSARVVRALRRVRTDLVLCMHPLLAEAAHRGLGGRIPFYVWSFGTDVWGPWSPSFERAMGAATRHVSISQHTAGAIWARIAEANIRMVPPMVDLRRFPHQPEPPPAHDHAVLLTVSRLGRVDRYKGHDVVMSALPGIETGLGRPVDYRVVGSGDAVGDLAELARSFGVADRVHFLGRLSDEDLVREYRSCDVFVMPSRMEPDAAGALTGEGFGIVYIEAQAAGRPVVASNQGGAPETIVEGVTGFAVDPTSPAAVSEAIVRVLTSRQRAVEMGREGRRWVEREFGPEAFQRRLRAALEEATRCAG